MYICKNCGKEFLTIKSYAGHMSGHSRKPVLSKKEILKVDKKHICKFCDKEYPSGPLLGNHTRLCKLNPKYDDIICKMKLASKNRKPISVKTRVSISEGLKLAHKEGRAWNIGMSRWNNKHSYPEKFFAEVINNEFNDKNFTQEYSIGIYSLDFAWVHKKKVIEIDGDQHQRFIEYKDRDVRKDELLVNEGWQVLRIIWKDMYKNTKLEIQKCKEFIDDINFDHEKYIHLKNIESENELEIKLNKEKPKQVIKDTEIKNIELLKEKLSLSKIEFSKFGWVGKAALIINVHPSYVNRWMKKHMLEFYDKKCFKKIKLR
jgi:very-short-patch-repair endonuclease